MSEHHKEHTHLEEEPVVKAQHFLQQNGKTILAVVAAIVVIVFGWIGYTQYIVKPKEDKKPGIPRLGFFTNSLYAVDSCFWKMRSYFSKKTQYSAAAPYCTPEKSF